VLKKDKSEILKLFGKNLRTIRESKGFTQEQLANELGLEIFQISRIERGVINTSIYTLYQVSTFFDIDIKEFFIVNE
jgi:transcriptional regulator with XRE-family HTH domain